MCASAVGKLHTKTPCRKILLLLGLLWIPFCMIICFSRRPPEGISVSSGTLVHGCVTRSYGPEQTVCVCTAKFCDVIEDPSPLAADQYLLYTSSQRGDRFNVTKKAVDSGLQSEGILFAVQLNHRFQCVEGFGGAITDSAAINLASLSYAAQKKLVEAYFGPKGIGYNIIRLPIGGTDFSTRPYSLADQKGPVLQPLANFNLTDNDLLYKIPIIKRARKISKRRIKLMAAAWMLPPWMRTPEHKLKPEFYSAWADYYIKFLESYSKHNLEMWLLSTGNAPLSGSLVPGRSTGWLPKDQRTWISQNLIPALKKSRFRDTRLLVLDDQRLNLPWWIDILMEDRSIAASVDAIGTHWYLDNVMPPSALDLTQHIYQNKFLISTEACFPKPPGAKDAVSLGSWERGQRYAENIIENLSHWSRGWIDWNLALNLEGGPNWARNFVDAAVIVNATADEFYKQPMFYAIGHFSKFVPAGSVRIGLIGGTSDVQGIAFLTPDYLIAVIILNKSTNEQKMSIAGTVSTGYANFVTPPKSITTYISKSTTHTPIVCTPSIRT